jgi:hypothetical protein
MVGLSGGGWSATFHAALDQRIRTSISVAGTLPIPLRRPSFDGPDERGDWEQFAARVFQRIDYVDLYALAGIPAQRRRHYQLYNEFDECCLQGVRGKRAAAFFEQYYPGMTSVSLLVNYGARAHAVPVDMVLTLLRESRPSG